MCFITSHCPDLLEIYSTILYNTSLRTAHHITSYVRQQHNIHSRRTMLGSPWEATRQGKGCSSLLLFAFCSLEYAVATVLFPSQTLKCIIFRRQVVQSITKHAAFPFPDRYTTTPELCCSQCCQMTQ